MKKIHVFIFGTLLCFLSCKGQSTDTKFYDKEFKWSIEIPKDFYKVGKEEWSEKQQKGKDAIEKTVGEEIVNQSKTIFIFKADDMNYFEANYQPYDTESDGDYLENYKNVNRTIYQTFKENMPNAKIDTLSSTEKINDLLFYKYEAKIHLPNNMILDMIMYSRLFDKKEFTVNIMFVDVKKGKQMMDAWKNSTFVK